MGRMRLSRLDKKCEEALEIQEQRQILQVLLEVDSPPGHTELRRQAQISSDDVFDKHLQILIKNGLVLARRVPEVHRQKVFYKPRPEAKLKLKSMLTPTIVASVVERFRLLFCRDPDEREVAACAGITPDQALNVLCKSSEWKSPREQDKLVAKDRAYQRLELAAWIELRCRDAEYVKRTWPREEFEKAEKILKNYPEYVPEIHAYWRREDREEFIYELRLPKVADKVTGATELYSDLKIPGVPTTQVPKDPKWIVVLRKVRIVHAKDLGPCIDRLRIRDVGQGRGGPQTDQP